MSGGGSGKVRETADQKEQARIGLAQQRRYIDKFQPLEEELIRDIRDTRDERGTALSDAASETTRAFGLAKPKVEAALTAAGARPGSAKFALGVTGMGEDEGASRGLSLAGASRAVDDQYYQGLEALAAMGRGQQAEAIGGLQDVAAMSGRQASSDALLSAENRAAWLGAAGGLAGAGAVSYVRNQGGSVKALQPMQPTADFNRPAEIPDFMQPMPRVG